MSSAAIDKSKASCHTCSNPGAPALSDEEIAQEMATLRPVWTLAQDKKSICRKFTCRNWQAVMNAIQEISVRAESKEIQHHPDLHITNYRDLEIVIMTHAVNGLTCNDFVLARAIDQISIDYSPKWLREHPEAAPSA